MSGLLAVIKGKTTKDDVKPAEDVQPQQSQCIRIEGNKQHSAGIPIPRPNRAPEAAAIPPPETAALADGRRKQAETSAEVRLISALVFSLYQIRISDPAVLCTATAFCLTRDCPTWKVKLITGALAKPNLPRIDNVLVVQTGQKHRVYIDFEWRERYRLKRTVPMFDQWFNSVSPVMVAPEASLVSQIKHNCLHCRNCFLSQAMEIPPWRRAESLISAYLYSAQVAIDVKPLCGYLLETLETSSTEHGEESEEDDDECLSTSSCCGNSTDLTGSMDRTPDGFTSPKLLCDRPNPLAAASPGRPHHASDRSPRRSSTRSRQGEESQAATRTDRPRRVSTSQKERQVSTLHTFLLNVVRLWI